MADITFDSSDVLQVISTDIEKFEYIGRSSTRGCLDRLVRFIES